MRSDSGFSVLEKKSSAGFQCRLWGASKTYFSFYRLFPWCTEVPKANSAAAELQRIAQPGYNPVAACPIHSQIKIQWLSTLIKQVSLLPLRHESRVAAVELPQVADQFKRAIGATEAGPGFQTPSAKAPRQLGRGKKPNSYVPYLFLRQFLRKTVHLKAKQTVISDNCISSISTPLHRHDAEVALFAFSEPEAQRRAALPASMHQHRLCLGRA